MKTESYTCDICSNPATAKTIFDATLSIRGVDHYNFHVCTTCIGETPKGVFQKAFNALMRLLWGK